MTGRLIHYSREPLTEVRSRQHDEDGCGVYKTPGLWVSVEGEDQYGWKEWCEGNTDMFEGSFENETEIILAENNEVLVLEAPEHLDDFTKEYGVEAFSGGSIGINWIKVRKHFQGLIIAPYQWSRRLDMKTAWYYGWDCASGVIWDANAIAEIRQLR